MKKHAGVPLHLLLPKKSICIAYAPSRANQRINLRLFVPLRPLLLLSDERSPEILRHVGHNCRRRKSINIQFILTTYNSVCELTCAEYTLGIFGLEGNHSSQCVIKIVLEISQNRRQFRILGCGRFPKLSAKQTTKREACHGK